VIQALLAFLAGWDDDQPPQFLREKNFLIPMPDGHYIALPMPLGFNLFPNLGRIATEFALRGGKDAGMMYVAGKPDHKVTNAEMVDKIVAQVEARAAILRAAKEAAAQAAE
jgi:hypothetical protein